MLPGSLILLFHETQDIFANILLNGSIERLGSLPKNLQDFGALFFFAFFGTYKSLDPNPFDDVD